jgi:signal transduction histidine kinase
MALALESNEGYNEREIVIERPDGRRLTALAHANPIHDESDNLIGAVNVLVDITERKRAEEELRTVREAERSRIARDLHDGVLQDLAAVVQGLEAARMEQKTRFEAYATDLHREIDTLRQATSKLRRAVYDLRSEKPPPFLQAIESLVEVNRQRAPECEVKLEVQDDFPHEIPDETGRELLRIVQEALTNARCHSEARNVRIGLEVEGADSLVVAVADDGLGFNPASADSGVGIEGMRERVSLLGGDMAISSEIGKRTLVRVRVPCP